MWKDYSIGFIKKNRASSVSVLVAAFISALFLSLLCGLFYNFWNYEIESVVLEEGNWQGRISGALEEDELSEIENFANVKTAAINEDLSDEQTLVVDICFDDMRAVYQDMPLIAQQLGVPETSVSYHESLLSSYFINDPQNSNPPLLMAFYLFVLLLVSVSLILIIHNSFAVSMNARVHQFGIFSSIGATPGQIRTCLLQDPAANKGRSNRRFLSHRHQVAFRFWCPAVCGRASSFVRSSWSGCPQRRRSGCKRQNRRR